MADSNLSRPQFGEQMGLFEESDPAMRRRTEAEMTPDQWRSQPHIFSHATFAPEMPTRPTSSGAAGIHLGTLEAARARLIDMGLRRQDIFPADRPSGDIYSRAVKPGMPMRGSMQDPEMDQGYDWTYSRGKNRLRQADSFGEYYRNEAEDKGSISVRVPDASYLQKHSDIVRAAIERGDPVHPMHRHLHSRGLLHLLDAPDHFDPTEGHETRMQREPFEFEQVRHDTLLPYKMTGLGRNFDEAPGGISYPSVTFAVDKKDVRQRVAAREWSVAYHPDTPKNKYAWPENYDEIMRNRTKKP